MSSLSRGGDLHIYFLPAPSAHCVDSNSLFASRPGKPFSGSCGLVGLAIGRSLPASQTFHSSLLRCHAAGSGPLASTSLLGGCAHPCLGREGGGREKKSHPVARIGAPEPFLVLFAAVISEVYADAARDATPASRVSTQVCGLARSLRDGGTFSILLDPGTEVHKSEGYNVTHAGDRMLKRASSAVVCYLY
jgi:hypothetical protein